MLFSGKNGFAEGNNRNKAVQLVEKNHVEALIKDRILQKMH